VPPHGPLTSQARHEGRADSAAPEPAGDGPLVGLLARRDPVTDSPFPKVDFPPGVPADAAANTWFVNGYREGIPRLLDLWDRPGPRSLPT